MAPRGVPATVVAPGTVPATHVGLDAHGRAVIAEEVTPGHTFLRHLLMWDDDAEEVEVVHLSEGHVVSVERLALTHVLFRLAYDEPLGFSYLDGGEIMFYGAPEDLRGGHWDRVTAATASC